jgi:mRNA-degrading endonuclease RelE of RelBE toxin-antitoxin system
MPTYNVKIPKHVDKNLKKIPLPWRHRIYKVLDLLETDPYLGDKMRGKYRDCYKVRVWPYRIIYKLWRRQLTIDIVEIDHRGNISYN